MDKYEWDTLDSWGMERSAFLLNCFWGRLEESLAR